MAKCKCCGSALDVIFIDRSMNYGDKVCRYVPPNNPNYPQWPNGHNITYDESFMLRSYHRNDIVLINGDKKQWVVYPSKNGTPYGDGWELLSDKEKKAAIKINQKMIETARKHPAYAKAMRLD